MDQNTIFHLAASLMIVLLVFVGSSAYSPLAILILPLALIATLLILLLAYADFLVFPLFTRLLHINIIPYKNYMIPKEQDAVIKYSNNVYYATGYISANIYNYVFAQESAEEDETPLVLAPDKWEKATMNVHFPFRFHLIAAAQDIQQYRDELETKRGLYEFQYSRELTATNPNPMGMEELQRKIRVVQARIDRLGGGERPVNSAMYIESTAAGVSEKDARDNLTKQLNELQTVFNVFDLSMARVYGRELYLLHKLNYIVPTLPELNIQFQQQS